MARSRDTVAQSLTHRLDRRRIMRAGLVSGASAGLLGLGVRSAGAQGATPAAGSGLANSAIFFFGDGVGAAHRTAGTLFGVGLIGSLVMDSLPVVGQVATSSLGPDGFVTDSAAAATAYGTGFKTINGAIGVDADGNTRTNIVELAKAAGKSVGLISTSQITDASPAGLAAHVPDRDMQSEIARQYIEDVEIDVILGGGEDRWLPEGTAGAYPDNPAEDPEEQSSSDQGNLIERAQQLGYAYVSDAAGLDGATGPKLLGLFANEEMFQQFPEGQGDIYDPVVTLDTMTAKAIEILSQNPNGFFLFVEEEATDEFSHANNATYVLKGMSELDRAVQVGLDYAASVGDTLVLVGADHECGGLTVEAVDDEDESGATDGDLAVSAEDGPFDVANSDFQFTMDWTTTGHTGSTVPFTATGPGSELLGGSYDNTEVFVALVTVLGLELPAGIATPGATPRS